VKSLLTISEMRIWSRAAILLATICSLESSLYAVLWRMRIAELWVNDCLELVTEPRLQYRFTAHFAFFLAGLFWLGVLVVSATFKDDEPKGDWS
jgi:hypothetical protein